MLPSDPSERKKIPLASGLFDYFPDALIEVAKVSFAANSQHNGDGPIYWDQSKSADHDDAMLRHFLHRGSNDEDGLSNRAKVAWRALAALQIEQQGRGDPIPRGARSPNVGQQIPDLGIPADSADGYVAQLLPVGSQAGED